MGGPGYGECRLETYVPRLFRVQELKDACRGPARWLCQRCCKLSTLGLSIVDYVVRHARLVTNYTYDPSTMLMFVYDLRRGQHTSLCCFRVGQNSKSARISRTVARGYEVEQLCFVELVYAAHTQVQMSLSGCHAWG